MNFDNQVRAIRYALKELHRERVKAVETKNEEWINDVDQYIFDLTNAIETIKAMQALKKVVAG